MTLSHSLEFALTPSPQGRSLIRAGPHTPVSSDLSPSPSERVDLGMDLRSVSSDLPNKN